MEDKTACYENIQIFNSRYSTVDSDSEYEDEDIFNRSNSANALFGVFDGHCGPECAQYVSTHLPMAIIEEIGDDWDTIQPDTIKNAFKNTNHKFNEKARQEVYYLPSLKALNFRFKFVFIYISSRFGVEQRLASVY